MTMGPPVTLDTPILLAVLWVALMLSYLLGDVLRIFSGDFTPGEIAGIELTGTMWSGSGS
jgi:ABC-type transport system involved in cytochrome c biogenesis permease component